MKELLAGLGFGALTCGCTVLCYEGLSLPFIGQVIDGVVAHRLEGYVTLVEKTEADAKAAEAQRQANAASQALKTANDQIASAKAAEAKASVDLEQRITSYEQQLAAAHRDCLADDADVDFILHNGAAADGLGHH